MRSEPGSTGSSRSPRKEGVELVVGGRRRRSIAPADVQVAIVLGGDGTMLRALRGFLGTGIPVIGVNFGRVGFLSAIARDELEQGVARVFAGELEAVELATLDVEAGGERYVAVNDAVVASGSSGGWSSSNGRSAARTSAVSPATA